MKENNFFINKLKNETLRIKNIINLIPSENLPSKQCRDMIGSILTYKYAEGYPGRRYYNGCNNFDKIEIKTQQLFSEIFKYKYVNVQPHSGSQGNQAIIFGLLKSNDTILSLKLKDGAHLTHGASVSLIGKIFNVKHFELGKNNLINYDLVMQAAIKYKPSLIICGFTSYTREFSFKKFSYIAKKVNALLLADISHICGLILTGFHNDVYPWADIVMTTTHKTLRGPRGGVILTNNKQIYKKINKMLFPGLQGGPSMNIIAAKGIAALESQTPTFHTYIKKVKDNAKMLENEFKKFNIIPEFGGTDIHMILINTELYFNKDGKKCADLLEKHNIIVNCNQLPNSKYGIRIGSPFMTSLGKKKKDFKEYVHKIIQILSN